MAILTQYDPWVVELMKQLGLPKHTVSFKLRVAVDEAVTVECTYYPDPAEPWSMGSTVHRTFKLVPRDEG